MWPISTPVVAVPLFLCATLAGQLHLKLDTSSELNLRRCQFRAWLGSAPFRTRKFFRNVDLETELQMVHFWTPESQGEPISGPTMRFSRFIQRTSFATSLTIHTVRSLFNMPCVFLDYCVVIVIAGNQHTFRKYHRTQSRVAEDRVSTFVQFFVQS